MEIIDNYFDIYYSNKKDEEYAKIFLEVLQIFYTDLLSFFGMKINESQRFNISIYHDRELYRQKIECPSENFKDWMIGSSNNQTGEIVIMSPDFTGDLLKMKKVLKHEFVHTFCDYYLNPDQNLPLWIMEGIAVYLANQIDYSFKFEHLVLVKDIEQDKAFYNIAGIYVMYIIDRHGAQCFKDIYSGRLALKDVFCKGFEKKAKKYFNKHK